MVANAADKSGLHISTVEATLHYLLGACLPFVVIGPQLVPGVWLSPNIFLGVAISAFAFTSGKVTKRFLLLCLMALVFTMTSLGRHPLSSFILSITALLVIMLPLTLPARTQRAARALMRGFVFGFILTMVIMWLEITFQILGLNDLHVRLTSLFRGFDRIENTHNWLVFYYRPQAAFMEPANLGIYLTFSFVIFDLTSFKHVKLLKILAIISILALGSMAAYFLLLSYVIPRVAIQTLSGTHFRITLRSLISFFLTLLVLCTVYAVGWDVFAPVIEYIFTRAEKLLIALKTGALESSEGSRGNALAVLPLYWANYGVSGFLFGTGYGNYQAWLFENFGHLESWATLARGQVDNLIVGIFLSTGLVGMSAYVAFIVSVFSKVKNGSLVQILIFFIAVHFSSGLLIGYYIWHLVFVLVVITRLQPIQPQISNLHTITQSTGGQT